jgi:iron complex transport system permease protein
VHTLLGLLVLVVLAGLSVLVGAGGLGWQRVLGEIVAQLTGGKSPVSEREAAMIWQPRVSRVVLAGIVGAALARSGTAFQGVSRNPLANLYLLGAAARAGMAATSWSSSCRRPPAGWSGRSHWPRSPERSAGWASAGCSASRRGGTGTATLLLAGWRRRRS